MDAARDDGYGSIRRRRPRARRDDDPEVRDGYARRRWGIALVVGVAWAGLLAYLQPIPQATARGTGAKENGVLLNAFRRSDTPAEASKPAQPNVVFIMVDDMGWNDIGYQSTDLHQMTPTIDYLASRGVKLTQYYSMYLCTPARASLMTGRYVFRYGMQYSVIQPAAPWGLPLNEKTMPEYFQENGYKTHMVGKWHLGMFVEDYLPINRGFDTFVGYLNDEEDYWEHQVYSEVDDGLKFFDFGYGDHDGYVDVTTRRPRFGPDYVGKYSMTVFTDRAVDIIWESANSSESEPFFLYYASQAVHAPLNPPSDSEFSVEQHTLIHDIPSEKMLRKQFGKVLMYLDMSVKRVVMALEEAGLADNTLLVLASDNGGCTAYGGCNFPLRGEKFMLWEGGFHVPAFVYSASSALLPESARGTKYHGMMHVTDWIPTLANAANMQLDAPMPFDGIDQWEAITGRNATPPRNMLIYNFDPYESDAASGIITVPPKGAIRIGKWKLIVQEWCGAYYSFKSSDEYNADTCANLTKCWNCGNSCFQKPHYKSASYLFNIEADPKEQYNLIDELPHVAGYLYKTWIEETKDYAYTELKATMAKAAENVWSHHAFWVVPWWDTFLTHNDTSTPDCCNPAIPQYGTQAPTAATTPAPTSA